MFLYKHKNSHPAATGRFASHGEIVSNFSYSPFALKSKRSRQGIFVSLMASIVDFGIYSNILLLVLALIVSVIITVFLNKGLSHPVLILVEYIGIWVVLVLFLTIFRNKFNAARASQKIDVKGLPGNFRCNCAEGTFPFRGNDNYKRNKPLNIGILNGNKKFPNLLIGIDRKKRFEHAIIISPTGGGKTSRFIIPSIINDAHYDDVSLFTIDIDSPYLYESVNKEWIKSGKKSVHFDPYDPAQKIRFNPLINREKRCIEDGELYNLSSLLFSINETEINGGDIHAHKYYSKRSSDIFYGCLLYLKYKYDAKYFNLVTVKSFFEKGIKFIETQIGKFNKKDNKKVQELFNNFFELPSFERAKIVTDILNTIDFLNDENVATCFKSSTGAVNDKTENEDFFIEDFFENDTLFIVGIPKERIVSGGAKLISFITGIFINAIYKDRRKKLRERNKSDNQGDSRDIFIYLDEFPALSLNNFDIELANLRKINTGVCITAQDIAFIRSKYKDLSLITANIGTHIIIGHASYETCKYYSDMLGEKYIFHKELVGNNLRETSVASGLYPLMSANEIKNMDTSKALIYTKYINPFVLTIYSP